MADLRRDNIRVNERIRAREIRVIGAEGEQLGIMTPEDARQRADEAGLDLVEVAPNSTPPVCRIMDYGRYKYEQKKKTAKSRGHAATLKEVKMRPGTDLHDLEFKLRNARRFLMEGDKVKMTVMFRGREIVHRRKGHEQLDRVTQLLGNLATVENPPRMEGRFLSMILVPNREGVAEARRAEAATDGKDVDAETEAKEAKEAPVEAGEKIAMKAGEKTAVQETPAGD